MTTLHKVFGTAAFRLTLIYLLIFMTIAGLVIGYMFWRTNNLLTDNQARVEALARRSQPGESDTRFTVGDLILDRLSHKVTRGDEAITLQPREFRLLEYLMKNAGQVVTRTMLLENVWDYHFDPQTNVIDVHISRLRSKIDKNYEVPLLHTVRGAGYVIRDNAS